MPIEPVSTSTAGIALAAGTITLTGSVFGVQYEALLAGFFGGLCYLSYVTPATKLRIATSLATASLLAGFFAPFLTVGLLKFLPWLSEVGDGLRIGVAAWVGLAGQSAMPFILAKLNKKIGE